MNSPPKNPITIDSFTDLWHNNPCQGILCMKTIRPVSFELIHGSGNVFYDFGYSDADMRQAKALLAAKILNRLECQGLSLDQAEALTGVPRLEFSRIAKTDLSQTDLSQADLSQTDLSRLTLGRLLYVCNRLGTHVGFSLSEEAPAAL
jgi:predicted XRE-type DNA-binding protein